MSVCLYVCQFESVCLLVLLVSPLAISSRSGSGYLLTLCVRHDAYEHMPTLNDKINEAAHDTGYFAGATKEKVRHSCDQKSHMHGDSHLSQLSETGEKLSESVHDAKETLKQKLFGAAYAYDFPLPIDHVTHQPAGLRTRPPTPRPQRTAQRRR